MHQYNGLIAGYNAHRDAGKALQPFDFFMLNGCGDLFDLLPATTPSLRKDFARMSLQEFEEHVANNGHCSALVKLNGDFSQLFLAHSSWFRYASMIRIMKHCESVCWIREREKERKRERERERKREREKERENEEQEGFVVDDCLGERVSG